MYKTETTFLFLRRKCLIFCISMRSVANAVNSNIAYSIAVYTEPDSQSVCHVRSDEI